MHGFAMIIGHRQYHFESSSALSFALVQHKISPGLSKGDMQAALALVLGMSLPTSAVSWGEAQQSQTCWHFSMTTLHSLPSKLKTRPIFAFVNPKTSCHGLSNYTSLTTD